MAFVKMRGPRALSRSMALQSTSETTTSQCQTNPMGSVFSVFSFSGTLGCSLESRRSRRSRCSTAFRPNLVRGPLPAGHDEGQTDSASSSQTNPNEFRSHSLVLQEDARLHAFLWALGVPAIPHPRVTGIPRSRMYPGFGYTLPPGHRYTAVGTG